MRNRFVQWAAAALVGLCAVSANAQYALKIVVGYPPGDAADVTARLMAERMRETLGRPVVVENRAGGGGIIAAELVKSAPADGNTLMLAPLATMVAFPFTFERLRYDPVKDFEPVALVASFDLALAVNAATGPATLQELGQRAAKDGVFASFGSPAAGSLPHFFGLITGESMKVNLLHVAYRGDAPAKQALLGGEVGSMVAPVGAFVELEKAGKVRILATSGTRRHPLTPKVPTFIEAGVQAQASPWFALYAPAKTPKELVAKLSASALDAANDARVKARLADLGLQSGNVGPQGLADTMRRDAEKWGPVIRASGFKAN